MVAGRGSADGVLLDGDVKSIIEEGTPVEMFERKRVLILTPDATRTCPLPMMVRAIQQVIGTRCAGMDFMVALGTHPPCRRNAYWLCTA